ncbi:MAG: hypothetical protein GY861_02450 [bacterium]|nr:hypothetical protein [bacterium]
MFGRKLSTEDQDIWVTSDLHFWHKNVMKFCKDTRPWDSLEEMHEALIEEWNSKVKPDDIIFSLGDFSFAGKDKTLSILNRLQGNKVFIMGNHCKVFRSSLGQKNTYDYLELRVDGVKICMSHFPMASYNQQGRGALMLFGHTHGSYHPEGRTMDVGYDNLGKIANIKDVMVELLSRDIYTVDHHKKVD